ncbi:MAG: peptide chain release factor N(5)-glutamine methyltransferase [Ktedonobacteraceae bacterium]
MVTIQAALQQGARELAAADLQGVRLDAQVLLAHVLGLERAQLYAYPQRELTLEQEQDYHALLARRREREPIAYIVGHKEFYGLDLFVDRRVLIPRPETELLVEAALVHIRSRLSAGESPLVADIGTGSGAIAIAIAVEEPRLPAIFACDISAEGLEVARINCERHHVGGRVKLLQGNLLDPLQEPVDLLLANLPYVGTREIDSMTPDVLAYEPQQALFSGPDGLDLLLNLCAQAKKSATLRDGGVMLLEIGYQQCKPLTRALRTLWPHALVTCKKDYAGWDRLVEVVV